MLGFFGMIVLNVALMYLSSLFIKTDIPSPPITDPLTGDLPKPPTGLPIPIFYGYAALPLTYFNLRHCKITSHAVYQSTEVKTGKTWDLRTKYETVESLIGYDYYFTFTAYIGLGSFNFLGLAPYIPGQPPITEGVSRRSGPLVTLGKIEEHLGENSIDEATVSAYFFIYDPDTTPRNEAIMFKYNDEIYRQLEEKLDELEDNLYKTVWLSVPIDEFETELREYKVTNWDVKKAMESIIEVMDNIAFLEFTPRESNKHYTTYSGRIFLGNSPQIQEIKVYAARWLAGDSSIVLPSPDKLEAGSGKGCNPVGIILDLLTNSLYGLGLDMERINRESFETAWQTVELEDTDVSFYMTNEFDYSATIQEMLILIDGTFYLDGAGNWTLRLIRESDIADPDSLKVFDEKNIITADGINRSGSFDIVNTVDVEYSDFGGNLKQARAENIANIISNRNRRKAIKFTCHYLRRFEQAYAFAQRELDARSINLRSLKITIDITDSAELYMGMPIVVRLERLGLDSIFRVMGFSCSPIDEAKVILSCVEDRFARNVEEIDIEGIAKPLPEPETDPVFELMTYDAPRWLARSLFYSFHTVSSSGIVEFPHNETEFNLLLNGTSDDSYLMLLATVDKDYDKFKDSLKGVAGGYVHRFKITSPIDYTDNEIEVEAITTKLLLSLGGLENKLYVIDPNTNNEEIILVIGISDSKLVVRRGCIDTAPKRHGYGDNSAYLYMIADFVGYTDPVHALWGSDTWHWVNSSTDDIIGWHDYYTEDTIGTYIPATLTEPFSGRSVGIKDSDYQQTIHPVITIKSSMTRSVESGNDEYTNIDRPQEYDHFVPFKGRLKKQYTPPLALRIKEQDEIEYLVWNGIIDTDEYYTDTETTDAMPLYSRMSGSSSVSNLVWVIRIYQNEEIISSTPLGSNLYEFGADNLYERIILLSDRVATSSEYQDTTAVRAISIDPLWENRYITLSPYQFDSDPFETLTNDYDGKCELDDDSRYKFIDHITYDKQLSYVSSELYYG